MTQFKCIAHKGELMFINPCKLSTYQAGKLPALYFAVVHSDNNIYQQTQLFYPVCTNPIYVFDIILADHIWNYLLKYLSNKIYCENTIFLKQNLG